jgi:hypothetical protein
MLLIALPLLLVQPACGTDEQGIGPMVRDSAGILLIENDLGHVLWDEATAWQLSDEPRVSIGSADAGAAYILHQAVRAQRLPDGSLAVATSGTSDVRLYAPDGRHLRTLGRSGNGPGEFRSPWLVFGLGEDSVVVVDLYRKVSVFGPDGGVREFGAGELGGEGPIGQFGDGSLLSWKYIRPGTPLTGGEWSQVELLRRDLSEGAAKRVRVVDYFRSDGPGVMNLFAPRASMAAGDTTVWYSRGDALALEEARMDGQVVRIVRLSLPPVLVTDAHKSRVTDALVEANPGSNPEDLTRNMEFPESFPAHGSILVDAGGNVWVQDYAPWGSDDSSRTCYVFDADGQFLGEVMTPAGLSLQDIGEDWALGLHRDDLGVERLQLYELEKPAG